MAVLMITIAVVLVSARPLEEDGVHKPYTYGWSDGANDGIPPGFKAILEKAERALQDALKAMS